MALSSHVIHRVCGVMGQFCAGPASLCFSLLKEEAPWQSAEPFVYLILGSWINQECPDMNLGMFFFHGEGNCGKWDLSKQRTIPGNLL